MDHQGFFNVLKTQGAALAQMSWCEPLEGLRTWESFVSLTYSYAFSNVLQTSTDFLVTFRKAVIETASETLVQTIVDKALNGNGESWKAKPIPPVTYSSLQKSLRAGFSKTLLRPKDTCPTETEEALLYNFSSAFANPTLHHLECLPGRL